MFFTPRDAGRASKHSGACVGAAVRDKRDAAQAVNAAGAQPAAAQLVAQTFDVAIALFRGGNLSSRSMFVSAAAAESDEGLLQEFRCIFAVAAGAGGQDQIVADEGRAQNAAHAAAANQQVGDFTDRFRTAGF